MTYMLCLFLFGLVMGLVAVASHPSPYYAALGMVVVSGMGCGILLGHGGAFLSLVLLLIYLGGMLVVFAYSAALAAEPYPESWGGRAVFMYVVFYLVGVMLGSMLFWGEWHEPIFHAGDDLFDFYLGRGDRGGIALVYSSGGGMLVITAWVLFLALFVVLELTHGGSKGVIRVV
nr:NADH dehydrogenase subunit 6 [Ariomma brevimanus]